MKFPQNFLAGAGVLTAGVRVLTAGAGGEMTEVCTALFEIDTNFLALISPSAKHFFSVTYGWQVSSSSSLFAISFIYIDCKNFSTNSGSSLCMLRCDTFRLHSAKTHLKIIPIGISSKYLPFSRSKVCWNTKTDSRMDWHLPYELRSR